MLGKYWRMISIKGKIMRPWKVLISLCRVFIKISRQLAQFFQKIRLIMLKELIQTILRFLRDTFSVKFIVLSVQVNTWNQNVQSKKDADQNVLLYQYQALILQLNGNAKLNFAMLIVELLNENLKKQILGLSQRHQTQPFNHQKIMK